MSVNIYLTFTPCLHVEESIANPFKIEVTTIVTTITHHIVCSVLANLIQCFFCSVAVIWNLSCLPTFKRVCEQMITFVCINSNILCNTLVVLNGTSKVNATHSLNNDSEFVTFVYGRNSNTLLIFHTVDATYIFIVDKYLCKVVTIINIKCTRICNSR